MGLSKFRIGQLVEQTTEINTDYLFGADDVGSPTIVMIVDRDELQKQGAQLFTKSKEFLQFDMPARRILPQFVRSRIFFFQTSLKSHKICVFYVDMR